MAAHSNVTPLAISEEYLFLKYRAVIHDIGPMVSEFVPHGILVFFGETAPAELREVALIHDGSQLAAELAVGDLLKFVLPSSEMQEAEQCFWFRLTAVGDMANANLAELGHIVVHFDAAVVPNLPGTISVEPSLATLPPPGTRFELLGLKANTE